MAWYPGSEGLGVAEVLYGVGGASFTGKLPVTWKVDATETPVLYCDASVANTDGNGTADACADVGDSLQQPGQPARDRAVPVRVRPFVRAAQRAAHGQHHRADQRRVGRRGQHDHDQRQRRRQRRHGIVGDVPRRRDANRRPGHVVALQRELDRARRGRQPFADRAGGRQRRRDDDLGGRRRHRDRELHRHVQERHRDATSIAAARAPPTARTAARARSTPTARATTAWRASARPPSSNVPPTVSITAPLNGASVVAGSTITISANAADSDGTVSSVTFFVAARRRSGRRTRPRPTA